MSVTRRILLIVVVALAALLIVTGSSINSLDAARGRFDFIHQNTVPSIRSLNDATQDLQSIRLTIRDFALAESDGERAALRQRIEEYSGRLDEALAGYEKNLILDAQDARLLADERKAWSAVQETAQSVLKLIAAGDQHGTHTLLGDNGTFTRNAHALVEALGRHTDYNWKQFENSRSNNTTQSHNSMLLQVAIFILAGILLGFMGWRLISELTSRLARLSGFMGEISQSLNFTMRLRITRRDEIGRTAESFNQLLDKLQSNLGHIARAARAVAESARSMADTSQEVATTAQVQSESATQMAATVEQMTVSVNHVADRAGETNQLVNEAGNLSNAGEAVIGRVTRGITSISDSVSQAEEQIRALETHSKEIAGIVQVIKEVADQTNLLALNAAIEAARAGEQGRGFAVVADEVRDLAERTSSSTQEINQTVETMRANAMNAVSMMQDVVSRVTDGVSSATEASTAITQIGSSSRQAVDMVDEIAQAIREQGAATNSIAQQVERIARVAEQSSATAQTTAGMAGELNRLAGDMQGVIAAYRLENDTGITLK